MLCCGLALTTLLLRVALRLKKLRLILNPRSLPKSDCFLRGYRTPSKNRYPSPPCKRVGTGAFCSMLFEFGGHKCRLLSNLDWDCLGSTVAGGPLRQCREYLWYQIPDSRSVRGLGASAAASRAVLGKVPNLRRLLHPTPNRFGDCSILEVRRWKYRIGCAGRG